MRKFISILAFSAFGMLALFWGIVSVIVFFGKFTPNLNCIMVGNLVWCICMAFLSLWYMKVPFNDWYIDIETTGDSKLIEKEKCAILICVASFVMWMGSLLYAGFQSWVVNKTQVNDPHIDVLINTTFFMMLNTLFAYVMRMQYKVISFKEKNINK